MKKIYLLFAFTSLGAMAAESHDTAVSGMEETSHAVVCGNGGDNMSGALHLYGGASASDDVDERADRWSFDLPFMSLKKEEKNKNNRYRMNTNSVYFGWVTALGSSEVEVDMSSSCELGGELFMLKSSLGKRQSRRSANRHKVSISFGIGWRNYRMAGRTRFVKDADGSIAADAYPERADIGFSRLKTFSLFFPLRYTFGVSRDFRVSAAAVLSLNTYGSLKTCYVLDGKKSRIIDKNIHQRPVSVEFQADAAWRFLGVYVRYSPCDLLKKSFGPGFKPLSVGVKIFF